VAPRAASHPPGHRRASARRTARPAPTTAAHDAEGKLAEYRRKRDFTRSAEPTGGAARRSKSALQFVVQKHAATHLHFDLRLELDGVMKSWAVPKGPSLDPTVKRLAMEVEDHPIEYNTFEGTIPAGEYGGGTVMLWDRGTYTAEVSARDPQQALRDGYRKGDLKLVLHGERLRGSWVLVRTRRGEEGKPQWLLIKHRDEYAEPGSDITSTDVTSVATGRTMQEIATGFKRVWHSNRPGRRAPGAIDLDPDPPPATRSRSSARPAPTPPLPADVLQPMLASIGTDIPRGDGWTFEPKYDGIRLLAFATPRAVRLVSRNGKDKTKQFPELAAAVQMLASKARRPLVLDGEVVALVKGAPARFQELQSRMHVSDTKSIETFETTLPVAFIVFDLLMDGDDVLVHEPWTERRRLLELRLRNRTTPNLRLSESVPNAGRELLQRARVAGWEGIIAKRTDAPYQPGRRSKSWLKLKIEFQEEFVVGGYTDPRNSREYIGALLLGYYDGDRLIYAGHAGGGFDRQGLKEMYQRLHRLERKTSPFAEVPKTNEPPHWVRPEVVVEVKFSQWTGDGRLRQPIYLGTRDDKDPRDVRRESQSIQQSEAADPPGPPSSRRARSSTTAAARPMPKRSPAAKRGAERAGVNASLVQQLDLIERSGGSGTLRIARGQTLDVTNLDKVYFPEERLTKGDLLRYYARVAPAILPVMADRPLVLKRTPEGIAGESFFQQNAPERPPAGVRVASVGKDENGNELHRIIGGDLVTLLYIAQLGCISVDPWHSRIGSLDTPDYTILDLDPGPKATFRLVIQVAQWVRAELDKLSLHAALKTSGSRGLHIVVPLPTATSYETGLLIAQLVATRVASAHPTEATVARSVRSRAPGTVYVDYLQNIKGKSVAAAYCVRARPGATVSAPLEWSELKPTLDLHDFTIESVPVRLARRGDLWGAAMKRRNTAGALRGLADL